MKIKGLIKLLQATDNLKLNSNDKYSLQKSVMNLMHQENEAEKWKEKTLDEQQNYRKI